LESLRGSAIAESPLKGKANHNKKYNNISC